jgi:hypothetical protein
VEGAAPATLANCELAIQSWSTAMEQDTGTAASASRSFFFFSGHGLEVSLDAQVLLPSDYLRRPGRSVNDAISTGNLLRGLASSPVSDHLLFADACRNDVPELGEYIVEGRKILNERMARNANPDAVSGILYAAASGTETWQPRELDDGCSLFGTALLQGLGGDERIERMRCDGAHCEIQFAPLQSFVKARMAELLVEFSSPEKARVRQGGSPPDGGITLVADGPQPPPGQISPVPALAARFDVTYSDLAWTPGGDYEFAHNLFGSERMTDVWTWGIEVHDLETGDRVPRDGVVVREVRRSSDTKTYAVSVELPRTTSGHWLALTDPRGRRFATSLAADPNTGDSLIYDLALDFEFDDREAQPDSSRRWISAFEARLSPLNDGLLGRMAEIWNTYDTRNVAAAVGELLPELQEIVRAKLASPLASTVAAVLLRRAGRLDLIPSRWLENLSEWFPDNPDGPVLRIEQDRQAAARQGDEEGKGVLLEQTGLLVRRGLPRLSELVPVAWRQLSDLAATAPLSREKELYLENLETAMKYYRPGGLFAVYASATDTLEVGLVQSQGTNVGSPG